MRQHRARLWTVAALLVLLGGVGYAAAKLKGWVTQVDLATHTLQLGDQTISMQGKRITKGTLEIGAFVAIEGGKIEVKPQRLPPGDEIVRFAVKTQDNPGRVAFSHLRHFNALGDKQCKTCHSPEMGLVTSPSYGSQTPDPTLEVHSPQSLGRYCATCHNGVTRFSQVGTLRGRQDTAIFTAFKINDPRSCQHCHAPADHGEDFTATHGDVSEKHGKRACLPCHAQDWGAHDRQMQRDLLAAEKTLQGNPDDAQAALVVGPHNFCVYCHRTDHEWLEE